VQGLPNVASKNTKYGPLMTEIEKIRLNVFLQKRGIASRRGADELISKGLVEVNGCVVSELGFKVNPTDEVTVDGMTLSQKEIRKRLFLFHKPDLTLTSRASDDHKKTIFQLDSMKALPANAQAVGRLDFRSEGLLILTNDGDLSYALMHPRFSVEKTYAVFLNDLYTPDITEKLLNGIHLEDGLARAVKVRKGGKEQLGKSQGQWVEITVTEGRNRLVRRMFEALGYKVLRLVRTAIGDVLLPSELKPGEVREALPVERKYLLGLKSLINEDQPKKPRVNLYKKRLYQKRKQERYNKKKTEENPKRKIRSDELGRVESTARGQSSKPHAAKKRHSFKKWKHNRES